ncbi:Guanine nucleotide-binding protein-like 3 [Chytridiales sp. JEL 0842]|nr:Guanine nucleotide-binding protein-like 3 [Chytridiales sp. JEL 0842]
MSAKMQYKIKAKVNEHNRKLRKEAKKNPIKKKLKKDPGIPSLFPYKEKLLHQIEETKKKAAEEKLQAKKAKSDQQSLVDIVKNAARRTATFEAAMGVDSGMPGTMLELAASGKRDNSRKAYYREFRKVVEAADVILEVLDARDPLGSRVKQIEETIINAGISKRIILILNKIDLVPRETVEKWLKYLRNEFPTVAFKASTQNQRTNLARSSVSTSKASDDLLNSSECLGMKIGYEMNNVRESNICYRAGADNLVQLLKNYCRNAKIKTSITVGVIGFPNVGKSSVINSLKRSKACTVGSTPGVTKVAQEIHLDKNIKLLDCPGIIFSTSKNEKDAAEVLLRNCVKTELIEDPIAPVDLILSKCRKEQLMLLYNLPAFSDVRDFLIHLARQRGKLKKRLLAARKGGIPDLENTARSVINDWNSGRIPFYTVPPASGIAVDSHVSSSIVSNWSEEFQLAEIAELENASLVNLKGSDAHGRMLAMNSGVSANVDLNMVTVPEGYNLEGEDGSEMEEEDAEYVSDDDEDEMEEDEEEEEEEEEDDMDEDAMEEDKPKPSSKPDISLNLAKVKAPSKPKSAPAPVLDIAERLINPQTNKDIKKALKQKKKEKRRAQMVEEEYDFSEHFGLPGGADMEED